MGECDVECVHICFLSKVEMVSRREWRRLAFRPRSGVCVSKQFVCTSLVMPVAGLNLSFDALGGVTCVLQHRCRISFNAVCKA